MFLTNGSKICKVPLVMNSEQNQFIKQLVLQQLETHLNSMFKTQIRELWEEIVQPRQTSIEEMREQIHKELSNRSLDEISQFILENKPRKQRGMNGGRRKAYDVEGEILIGNEPKPQQDNLIDLE